MDNRAFVWAFGDNTHSELGLKDNETQNYIPRCPAGSKNKDTIGIAPGYEHTALWTVSGEREEDGQVYMVGSNKF